ncbi:MAG TPA: hypothetical protein GXZ64_05660 [Clostridiaceae bacterium]|jgi:serine/threonine protein phosphatase PrpC|nr:hypothetical protein [Clostridiaceae bacterium]
MASTIAYGLTESGSNLHVNEDALYLSGRMKPELIGGREVESGKFTERTQLFLVTDGFGGPGAGDLAGRIVFQVARQNLAKIKEDPFAPFDFPKWIRELMAEADRRIGSELLSRSFGQAGCSVALLLLVDTVAYTMSLGSASVYVSRNGELHLQAAPQEDADGNPLIHLGRRPDHDVPVAQNIKKLEIEADDRFLLLTDGAYRTLAASEIKTAMTDQQAFSSSIDHLFDLAAKKDAGDNRTLLAVKVLDRYGDPAETPKISDQSVYVRTDEFDVTRLSQEHRKNVYAGPDRRAAAPEQARYRHADSRGPARQEPAESDEPVKGKSLVSTFLKSLLLGFLIGLAIMLTLWFIFLS